MVPSQPTTLSQIGIIGGDLGSVGVPSMENKPDTAAPISSKPTRFDQGPRSPWRTTLALFNPGLFGLRSSAVRPYLSKYPGSRFEKNPSASFKRRSNVARSSLEPSSS